MTRELSATISTLVAIATVLLSMWLNKVYAHRYWGVLNARQRVINSGSWITTDATQYNAKIASWRTIVRRASGVGLMVVLGTMLFNGAMQWRLFVHHRHDPSMTWTGLWALVLISITPLLLIVQTILLTWMVVLWLWLGHYLRTPLSLVDPSV